MTTYAETQTTTDAANAWSAWMTPNTYSLFLAPAADGYCEVSADSKNPDKFEIQDIPSDITPVLVAQHLRAIAIWQHPDVLLWSAVADLPIGALLRVTREVASPGAFQIAAQIQDPSHWTGKRCIGWFYAQ